MDALRMAVGTVSPGTDDDEALALVARIPTIVAAYSRMLEGEEPVAPDPEFGHAANYLYMLTGEVPGAEFTRALDTYLSTVSDHGMNASTFAARVIVATRSDFVSAVVGAIGALKGPLHGGAPGPALDVVFEIGDASRAEAYLREKLGRGERLMGFGHRIYRVRDPRADVLAAAAERLYTTDGDIELYELALEVERGCACTARGAQARQEPADQRRVLHSATASRAWVAHAALHPDLRGGEGGWMDGALLSSRGRSTASSGRSPCTWGARMEAGCRSKSGSMGRYKKRPPEKSGGRTLLSVTQVSRLSARPPSLHGRRIK